MFFASRYSNSLNYLFEFPFSLFNRCHMKQEISDSTKNSDVHNLIPHSIRSDEYYEPSSRITILLEIESASQIEIVGAPNSALSNIKLLAKLVVVPRKIRYFIGHSFRLVYKICSVNELV